MWCLLLELILLFFFRKRQLHKQGINCGHKLQYDLHAEHKRDKEILGKLGTLILYPIVFISFILYIRG